MKNYLLLFFIFTLYLLFLIPFFIFSVIMCSVLEFLALIEPQNLFKNLRNKINYKLKMFWSSITLMFFHIYFPKNIFLSFDPKLLDKKRVILLSNHITYFDWLFIICILNRFNLFGNCSFTMKYDLREIPIIGFALEYLGHIFLKRKWQTDKYILDESLKKIDHKNFCIILFPEGTFLDIEGKRAMKKYLKSSNLKIKQPKFTLLPKKRGFSKIYNSLDEQLDLIVDVTLVSKPFHDFPADHFSIKNVFMNKCPFKLSVIVDTYKEIKEKTFLDEIFFKKEVLLKGFSKLEEEENLAEFARNVYNLTKKHYFYQTISLFSWTGVVNYLIYLVFMGIIIIV
ncbi:hypothetical protein CDIK_0530 [Cucumispora dikerogammari]|nr:hypothetical protein CDIK_0530 [Cucumispora dikerogammari]